MTWLGWFLIVAGAAALLALLGGAVLLAGAAVATAAGLKAELDVLQAKGEALREDHIRRAAQTGAALQACAQAMTMMVETITTSGMTQAAVTLQLSEAVGRIRRELLRSGAHPENL